MQRTIRGRVAALSLCIGMAACPALAQDFAATLTSKSGGPANCNGSFTYDDLGRQLTYRLSCDGLSGAATAVRLFGSVPSPVDMVLAVHSVPIVGTASLTASEAAALKGGGLTVEVQTGPEPQGEASGPIVAK
jgi:hypothetical protein